MAFLNDFKKLFFGAKSVTKSAAEKAVDATKEAGNDLWDRVQDTAADLGKAVSEKADLAMDKAAELTETAKEKVSDFVNGDPKPAAPTPDDNDVMDAIKKRLKPGTVLVTTDLAATPDTRTDKSMVVMDGPAK